MSLSDASTQRGAGIITIVLALAALLMVAVLAVSAVSAMRVNQVRRDWDDALGSWDEIMQRYPAQQANDSALELERLAARLGVDLVPRTVGAPGQKTFFTPAEDLPRVRPTEEQRARFERFRREVFGRYDTPLLERPERGSIEAPPAALVEFLEEHDAALSDLREHLLSGESPRWVSDLSKLWAAPLPNLLAQINLHKLLTNIALARLHAGDVPGALENVEASFRLADSLRDSPLMINQLIMIAATRMQLGVLRHVEDLPADWIELMTGHDYRESFLISMKYEGWVWAHVNGDMHGDRWWGRLAGPALRPYNKLCLAEISDGWRERLVILERMTFLCDRDLTDDDASVADIPIPRWNLLGESFVPSLDDAVHRLARLELDVELTRLLQEADAARRRNDGVWPDELGDERSSTTCPEDRWIYSADEDGLRIELSRPVSWPDQRGAVLPTRAVLR